MKVKQVSFTKHLIVVTLIYVRGRARESGRRRRRRLKRAMSKGISFSVDDILKREFSSSSTNLRDCVSSVDKSASPSSLSSINHPLLNNECKSVSSSPVSSAFMASSSSSSSERMAVTITASIAASNQHSSPYDTSINDHYSSHHLHPQVMRHTSPATSSSPSFLSAHRLRSHSQEHLWSLFNHSAAHAAAASAAAATTVTSKVNNFFQSTTGDLLNGRSHAAPIENYSSYKSSGSDVRLKHHHDHLLNSISFNHLPHLLYRQPIISGEQVIHLPALLSSLSLFWLPRLCLSERARCIN